MRSTSLSRSKSECNAEPAPATAGVGQEWPNAATDQIARIERMSIPKSTQVLTRLLGLNGLSGLVREEPVRKRCGHLATSHGGSQPCRWRNAQSFISLAP